MPLSSIVVIVIRLFALNWLLTAVPLLLSATTTPLPHERHLSAVLMLYVPAVLLLIVAAGLWILTPAIARFVSRGVDTSVSIGSLSRSDLYSFAFVFLGLFFILSSFGPEARGSASTGQFLQLHRAEVALDLLQRDPARGYLGSGAGQGRRSRPNLPGGTDRFVCG